MRLACVVIALMAASLESGCTRRQDTNQCVAGDQKACPCLGGGDGIQVCQADGTYAACQCIVDMAVPIDMAFVIDLGMPDLAPPVDIAVPVDLAPIDWGDAGITVGVVCGNAECAVTAQLCCTSTNGATGTCQSVTAPSCSAAEFLCDGPDDCQPANPECCLSAGFAACRAAGVCATISNASLMCHATSDCPGGQTCCPSVGSSPYRLCKTTC